MTIFSVIGHILLAGGGIIFFVSGLGILRMPDVLNRLHAGTKATTLGSMLFIIGIGCLEPSWIPKLLIIVIFILLTNPVSGHAIARAVHMRPEEKPDNLLQDDLAETGKEGEEE